MHKQNYRRVAWRPPIQTPNFEHKQWQFATTKLTTHPIKFTSNLSKCGLIILLLNHRLKSPRLNHFTMNRHITEICQTNVTTSPSPLSSASLLITDGRRPTLLFPPNTWPLYRASSITQPESRVVLLWLWCYIPQGNSTNEIHGYKNMHMRTRASVTWVQLKEGSTTPLVLMTSEPWSDRSEFVHFCFRLW